MRRKVVEDSWCTVRKNDGGSAFGVFEVPMLNKFAMKAGNDNGEYRRDENSGITALRGSVAPGGLLLSFTW